MDIFHENCTTSEGGGEVCISLLGTGPAKIVQFTTENGRQVHLIPRIECVGRRSIGISGPRINIKNLSLVSRDFSAKIIRRKTKICSKFVKYFSAYVRIQQNSGNILHKKNCIFFFLSKR